MFHTSFPQKHQWKQNLFFSKKNTIKHCKSGAPQGTTRFFEGKLLKICWIPWLGWSQSSISWAYSVRFITKMLPGSVPLGVKDPSSSRSRLGFGWNIQPDQTNSVKNVYWLIHSCVIIRIPVIKRNEKNNMKSFSSMFLQNIYLVRGIPTCDETRGYMSIMIHEFSSNSPRIIHSCWLNLNHHYS